MIDIQSKEVQRQIVIDDAQIYEMENEEIVDDSSVESGSYFVLSKYQEWITDDPEY